METVEKNDFNHIRDITIVIAALNEANNLKQVLPRIPSKICGLNTGILLVDDGSKDQTKELDKVYDIGFVPIPISLGQGAALRLGYQLALAGGAKIVVTMDADGQHRPEEIERLVAPIIDDTADFVIGSRILGKYEPDDAIRLCGVLVFSQLLSILLGMKITDCSNGFRAIRANVLDAVVSSLVQKQFHTSELLIIVAKRGYKIIEVPMTCLKRISGKSKKGNNLYFGLSFAKAMLSTWLREYCQTKNKH